MWTKYTWPWLFFNHESAPVQLRTTESLFKYFSRERTKQGNKQAHEQG